MFNVHYFVGGGGGLTIENWPGLHYCPFSRIRKVKRETEYFPILTPSSTEILLKHELSFGKFRWKNIPENKLPIIFVNVKRGDFYLH